MNRDDIIKALDWHAPTVEMGPQSLLRRIESLVAQAEAAERDRLEPGFKQLEALMQVRETQPNKPCCLAERERIIQFLQEMQRQAGDAHNYYGHAAVRIKEGV